MTDEEKARLLAYHARSYHHVRELPDGESWAAVCPQIFNAKIIRTRFENVWGIDDNW
jgi:hypothetical protein